MRKSTFYFHLYKRGLGLCCFLSCPPPLPNPLPKKGRGNIMPPFIREVARMCRRVLRKVRKPWFLLTRFFWSRVFFSFVCFFSSWLSALNGSLPMLRRHIATVCLATPSADNPLFHRKKRKETDIINNVFIDEKIPLLFPL